ncbi:hypothetical protein BC828DRAFT_394743 [Blastocladiella britannica]|nr:hypothetical protein BC828DRAFT_394743 [Blastocladiella britannica]
MTQTSKTLLVTGFGPFLQHLVNPSNLAVEHMLAEFTPPEGVKVAALSKLEVAYAPVRAALPPAHAHYRPAFTLHVGVGLPGPFQLERYGRNSGHLSFDVRNEYVNEDVARDGKATDPKKARAVDGPNVKDVYETALDLPRMVQALAASSPSSSPSGKPWAVEVSEDAGGYLCNFTYTNSLALSEEYAADETSRYRVLFLHVPPVGAPYSQEEIGQFVVNTVAYLCREAVAGEGAYRA